MQSTSQIVILSKLVMMSVMSVSENVAQQVCAIDHFTGNNSLVMINQFIQNDYLLTQENIPGMRVLCSRK